MKEPETAQIENPDWQAYAGFDLIGDVHGCASALCELLEKLGYQKVSGVYEYADKAKPRQVIFVGDIVDRGAEIRESLHIVRDMVARGSALLLMGNHEYNAITYSTRARPDSERSYLREHTERHTFLIQETLEQFANYASEWREFVSWMIDLPLFLEAEHFRVVHACWDANLIDEFQSVYGARNTIDWDFLHESVEKSGLPGRFMERLTRGVDLHLPAGQVIQCADGFERRRFRVNFWHEAPAIYDEVAFQPDPIPQDHATKQISREDRAKLVHYPADEKPLFVGHYWLRGEPRPMSSNVVCLDYSAVKRGKLVAYRMNKEPEVHSKHFVWVNNKV